MKLYNKLVVSAITILLLVSFCYNPVIAVKRVVKWKPYHLYGSSDVRRLTLYFNILAGDSILYGRMKNHQGFTPTTDTRSFLASDSITIFDSLYAVNLPVDGIFEACLTAIDTAGNESMCAKDTTETVIPVAVAGFHFTE